jgi:hypothetical protein
MSDGAEGFVLAWLGRMDEKLDRMVTSVADIGRRVTSLEN